VFEDGESADHHISLSAIGLRVKTRNASAASYQAPSCVIRNNPSGRATAIISSAVANKKEGVP
jgi:hypothetical protein